MNLANSSTPVDLATTIILTDLLFLMRITVNAHSFK